MEAIEIFHFTHQQHNLRLMFVKGKRRANKPAANQEQYLIIVTTSLAQCLVCNETITGLSYGCLDCEFYLHKSCAEATPRMFYHPFHCHSLKMMIYDEVRERYCSFCHKPYGSGFSYSCLECEFGLHLKCALYRVVEHLPERLFAFHDHPLSFIENGSNDEVDGDCYGCGKSLAGPIYRCLRPHCGFLFNLHKMCAELPNEIHHPSHPQHPLLLSDAETSFAYCCSQQDCNFVLSLEDDSLSHIIATSTHRHKWVPLFRVMSFTCDMCGSDGDHKYCPYQCLACNLIVHHRCSRLPRTIRITRHHHPISHTYSNQENRVESGLCRICYTEVDADYGRYRCFAPNCNYVAHANCATDENVWDGKALDWEDMDEAPEESMTLITQISATEIKHAYHDPGHNLVLTSIGVEELKDDELICDGCMRAISSSSTPFYSCQQCIFFLHKDCAELPRRKGSPLHKHVLTLLDHPKRDDDDDAGSGTGPDHFFCSVCHQWQGGFIYGCTETNCDFKIDIQCCLLPDAMNHPSHDPDHLLFLEHNNEGEDCISCPWSADIMYKCTKRCEFAVDLRCVTLPPTAWYKYDKHPLTLTFHDQSDPSQVYCDLCEEERHPSHCFYYCEACGNTVHPSCLLGDFPFAKLGSKHSFYEHSFTVVKKIWDCPPCEVCGKLCNTRFIQCQNCNLVIHWQCRWDLYYEARETCL